MSASTHATRRAGPGPRGDKGLNPDTGVAKSRPAGQGIPACAGMTTDGARGDKIKTLGPRGDTGERDMGMYGGMTRQNGANAPSFISQTNNPFPGDLDYMFRS